MHKSSTSISKQDWARLDARVRRVDEDRWLSSRYANEAERRALVALYAFNYELAKVRTTVSEAMLGAIRFQWWRDALEDITKGKPVRRHDVAAALAATPLDPVCLLELVDKYEDALEAEDPSLEPDGHLAEMAAGLLNQEAASDWAREAGLVGAAYGQARRGRALTHACVRLEVPEPLRPALAHARLIRTYASGAVPGPISKRLSVLTAMLTGRI